MKGLCGCVLKGLVEMGESLKAYCQLQKGREGEREREINKRVLHFVVEGETRERERERRFFLFSVKVDSWPNHLNSSFFSFHLGVSYF